MDEIKMYRAKFNRTLAPIKVMLVNRKGKLRTEEWLRLVELTQSRIILHPDQYLGRELPQQDTLVAVVMKIFDDFLQIEN